MERIEEGLLVGLLLFGVLAIGAVHPASMLVVGAVSVFALAVTGWLAMRDGRTPFEPPALVLWALAAVCLLQAIPLPMGLLKVLSPHAADVWSRSLLPLGEVGPAFASISLDPGASLVEALRWFSYGVAFMGASSVARRRGVHAGAVVVLGVALVAGVATVAHGLVGANKVWGLYEPDFKPTVWHVGPLLNPNNLAGLLNLGTLCGLGLMLEREPKLPRSLLFVVVGLLVGANVMSGSRGGVAVLLLGTVMLSLVVARQRHRRGSRRSTKHTWAILGGVMLVGAVLAVLGSRGNGYTELLDDKVDKLSMTAKVEPVIADHTWFGIGRGSFESVFPAYQTDSGYKVYTHVENFVAQWFVEWGVPVTLLALFFLGFYLRPHRVCVRNSTVAAAAYIGFLVLLIQNAVDLGLEIPGVALTVSVLLGTGWGAVARIAGSKPLNHRRARVGVAMAMASGVVLVGLSTKGLKDIRWDENRVHAALTAQEAPRPEGVRQALRGQIREAMKRHPAAPYFPLAGAIVAWQEGDQDPMPWLQRSLERSLANGRTHFVLARVLHGRGAHRQALLELRLAAERDPGLVGISAVTAMRWTQSIDELALAVPNNGSAGASWETYGRIAADRDLGEACDLRALEVDPSRIQPRVRLVDDMIAVLHADKPCDGCDRRVESHAVALSESAPQRSTAHLVRARWMAAHGKVAEAVEHLASVCDTVEDVIDCLRGRAIIAASINDVEPFASAAKNLRSVACTRRTRCAEAATLVGDLHVEREEFAGAVAAYERALADAPTDERMLKLAHAASKAGLHAKAMRTLQKLLKRRGGKDPALEKRIAAERARTVRGIINR